MAKLRELVIAFALMVAALIPVGSAAAQQNGNSFSALRLPPGASLVDLGVRLFGKEDGLQSSTVYAVTTDLSGRLWIGTENGPMRFDGQRWQEEALPAGITQPQTRAILQSSDSTMWFATRSGVVRRRGNTQTLFDVRHGLPGAVVYSIIETRAFGNTPQILAGTSAGIALFEHDHFRTVALPDSLRPEGLMLGETTAPDGSLELWLASSTGKVARYAKGQWSVFGAAEGFTGHSAEAIVPTHHNPNTRLLVPGEGGVFEFHDEGPRAPHFEHIPGSPRQSYRIAELTRTDGEHELWVGNLDGVLQRFSNGRWDTVGIASMPQGGRITALFAATGHAGGNAIYVGTYGGRLARIAVGSGGTLELQQGTRRNSLASIVAGHDVNNRLSLWMGAIAQVFHLGGDGVLTEFSRETGQPFKTVRSLAWLSGTTRSARQTDVDAGPGDVWISTDAGVFSEEGSRLVLRNSGIEKRVVRTFQRGVLPDGTIRLLAATDSGLFRWNNTKWEWQPEFGRELVVATAATTRGEPWLWVLTPHSTIRVSSRGVFVDSMSNQTTAVAFPHDSARLVFTSVTAMCVANDPQHAGRLFAATYGGKLWWRTPESAWMPAPSALLRAATAPVHGINCLYDGQLLIGTELGLVLADVRDSLPARWSVRLMAGQEDGLPATEIASFARTPVDDVMWMGTSRGVGALRLRRVETPPAPRLDVRLNLESRSEPLLNGAELPVGELPLTITAVLITNHRESDTRYRMLMHRDGDAPATAHTAVDEIAKLSDWTTDLEARYHALSAGNYTLHVWARDYSGRITAAPVMHFRVVPPLWRRWWALVAYWAAAAGAIYFGHRSRLRSLERTNKQLAASEQRVRVSERKFRSLFDTASDAHLLIDGTRITSINRVARELLQLPEAPAAEPADTPTTMDVHFALPHIDMRELTELAASESAHEYTFPQANGEAIPVSAQITRVPMDDRTLWHLVLRDLRSARLAEEVRLRLEDQVRDAQKLESLGTLAGGVAHDFNNLLGVIRGNVELARDTLSDANAVAAHLDTVFDASERARDLVRQILTFSRRSGSRDDLVDIAALARSLQPMLRSLIPSSVEIVVEGTDVPLFVQGDPTQLQQVLLNLVSNAEYAMRSKPSGLLHITLEKIPAPTAVKTANGWAVRLCVSDTGVGMEPAVLDRVFEPFYTTKPTGEGTGLGMAVLHGIVASHGGQVHASSKVGQGTTFEILLPFTNEFGGISEKPVVASADISAAPVIEADPPQWHADDRSGGRHIVLVDDEPTVARVGQSALTRMGYKVTVFAEPRAALDFVRSSPLDVDLVITDQTMPGFSGDVLAQEIHRARPDLPVIIVSGFSYVLTPDRLAEVGAHALLQKPVSLAALRTAVEAALGTNYPRKRS
ncbi:MAG: ATP-binding protein [Gemmatimonadaceae bacterium]